jgi:hypothetical protein
MKRLILSFAIFMSLTLQAKSQVLIGKTQSEIYNYYQTSYTASKFKYSDFTGGTLMTITTEYYKAYAWIDDDTKKCSEYFLIVTSLSFETSYRAALTRNHIKLSENKWMSKDYDMTIEYKWSSDMNSYIWLIQELD